MSPWHLSHSARDQKWEPLAEQLRRKVPKPHRDAVAFDPWKLAPAVGLTVIECSFQGLDPEEQRYLSNHASGDWSGGVFAQTLPDGSRVCMLNPAHPQRRNKITLMEEISHCYLGHRPTRLVAKDNGRVRDYERRRKRRHSASGRPFYCPGLSSSEGSTAGRVEELAEEFEVSQDLIRYRIKICGATHLYKLRNGRG